MYIRYIKRIFDFIAALFGILILSPLFLLIAIWVKLDSKGPVFYKQCRVGQNNKFFWILKFRSMSINAENGGVLTVGSRDPRVTRSGYYLRKCKLDELPQLINVLVGEMSIVGPRPETEQYIRSYPKEQMELILSLKPGITDIASIRYRHENDILKEAEDPHQLYTERILPNKIRYKLLYVKECSFILDLKIIFWTLYEVLFNREEE